MDQARTTTPGYRTQSRDTDEWADRMLFDHWGRMESFEKAALVTSLTRAVHRLSVAGLRQRFPHASEEELEIRAGILRLGPELAALAGIRIPPQDDDIGT